MAKFKVGDICVVICAPNYPELLGAEVTITGTLCEITGPTGEKWTGYLTDLIHKGHRICPCEPSIKLKEEPPKTKSTGLDKVLDLFKGVPSGVPVSVPIGVVEEEG